MDRIKDKELRRVVCSEVMMLVDKEGDEHFPCNWMRCNKVTCRLDNPNECDAPPEFFQLHFIAIRAKDDEMCDLPGCKIKEHIPMPNKVNTNG